jgi:hypothetical protein
LNGERLRGLIAEGAIREVIAYRLPPPFGTPASAMLWEVWAYGDTLTADLGHRLDGSPDVPRRFESFDEVAAFIVGELGWRRSIIIDQGPWGEPPITLEIPTEVSDSPRQHCRESAK